MHDIELAHNICVENLSARITMGHIKWKKCVTVYLMLQINNQLQAYFATFVLYMAGLHRRWNLPCKLLLHGSTLQGIVYLSALPPSLPPSPPHTHICTHIAKKSFYRYALFLSLVNVVQAVGSMLWFTGKHRPASGHAGIWYIATV